MKSYVRDTSPNDNVGRGFQTFRVRSSIIYRYSRNLVHPSRRKNNHIPVSDRQVRGYRRHGQELLPFPWHQVLDRLWISLTVSFMLRPPLADRCSQIPVAYLRYAAVWKEIRLLPSSDTPLRKTWHRCSVLLTGRSYRSFHSEMYTDCSYILSFHVQNGRCCAGLPSRSHQRRI